MKLAFTVLMLNDLALVTTCALVVLGLVFNVFAVIAVTFNLDPAMAWIFAPMGIALWMFAGAVFMAFINRPRPRHGDSR